MCHQIDIEETLEEQSEIIQKQADRIEKLTSLLLQYMTQEEIDFIS
jgi:hypothetical protein